MTSGAMVHISRVGTIGLEFNFAKQPSLSATTGTLHLRWKCTHTQIGNSVHYGRLNEQRIVLMIFAFHFHFQVWNPLPTFQWNGEGGTFIAKKRKEDNSPDWCESRTCFPALIMSTFIEGAAYRFYTTCWMLLQMQACSAGLLDAYLRSGSRWSIFKSSNLPE